MKKGPWHPWVFVAIALGPDLFSVDLISICTWYSGSLTRIQHLLSSWWPSVFICQVATQLLLQAYAMSKIIIPSTVWALLAQGRHLWPGTWSCWLECDYSQISKNIDIISNSSHIIVLKFIFLFLVCSGMLRKSNKEDFCLHLNTKSWSTCPWSRTWRWQQEPAKAPEKQRGQ